MTYSNGIHASRLLYLYIYEGWCSEDGSLSFDQHYQACSSCDIKGNSEFVQFLIFLWIPIWMMRLDLCVPLLLFPCLPRNSTGLSLICPLKHPSSPHYLPTLNPIVTWYHGRHVRDRKVVYLGETHGEPAVVGLHTAVLNTLVTQVQKSSIR